MSSGEAVPFEQCRQTWLAEAGDPAVVVQR